MPLPCLSTPARLVGAGLTGRQGVGKPPGIWWRGWVGVFGKGGIGQNVAAKVNLLLGHPSSGDLGRHGRRAKDARWRNDYGARMWLVRFLCAAGVQRCPLYWTVNTEPNASRFAGRAFRVDISCTCLLSRHATCLPSTFWIFLPACCHLPG